MGGCGSREEGPKIWLSRFPNVDIPDKTLHKVIFENGEQQRDRVIIIDGISGEEWTFGKLIDSAKAVAAGITAAGLTKGDVVAVYLPNHPLYFSIVYGALLSGTAATLINPAYQQFELDNATSITEPKIWFTVSSFVKNITDTFETSGAKQPIVCIDASGEGTTAFDDFVKPEGSFTEATDTNAIALLCYSSGTTGLPKAVALTHKNLVSNLFQTTAEPDHFIGFTNSDTLLAVLPFFHIYGVIMFLMSAPFHGTRTVSMPKFDPEKYVENLKKYNVTIAHVAPPIVQFLLKHPMVNKAMPFESLKEVFCAAAPLAPEPAEELKKKLNLDMVRQGFGMTELSPVGAIGDKKNPKAGAVGLLLPNMELKLINTEDGKSITERNTRGEIWIRGPNVMHGYYKNKEATDGAVDPEGFLHTGDVAYLDDDDQLWIVDRCKELIKVKGFQVAPAELEGHLLTHPKIADAAVIGVAAGFDYGGREGDGQLPKAFVVRKDESLTEEEVLEFIKKDFVDYKRLAACEFLDVIPKSASGKILRKDLRKREEDAGRKVFA